MHTHTRTHVYMWENKSNFSSGYFPDFILYPCVERPENVDFNLEYYPEFSDGKYTKQLSNIYSKYDNHYFGRMYSIYKICKKFWKLQEKSPSCRTVADSYYSKDSQDHTLQSPGCRIVAKSSRIGTTGDVQRLQPSNDTKSTMDQPPSCRIVANGSRIGAKSKSKSKYNLGNNENKHINNNNNNKIIAFKDKYSSGNSINSSNSKCSSNSKDKIKNNSSNCKYINDINNSIKNKNKNSRKLKNIPCIQQEEPPGCRIVENKQTIESTGNQFPGCRIVANDSRIGIIEGN